MPGCAGPRRPGAAALFSVAGLLHESWRSPGGCLGCGDRGQSSACRRPNWASSSVCPCSEIVPRAMAGSWDQHLVLAGPD
ncbi:hypothetical protein ACOMHN_053612 [Nucella lapillus]